MTLKFESQNDHKPIFKEHLSTKASHVNQPIGIIDMLKRDRFELLSAYLDGEVTAAERRQVEEWLANEPEVQCLYRRLLKLRQEVRSLPVPPAQQSVEQTIDQVFKRVNRRVHLALIGGGTAIAALFIGTMSGGLLNRQAAQIAQAPEPLAAPNDTLMVALNAPVVEIPKAAIATPENAIRQTELRQNRQDNVN